MAVIDLTLEMERRQENPDPCEGCMRGYSSIGQYIDSNTGHLMQESHDCSENCEELKTWNPFNTIKGV